MISRTARTGEVLFWPEIKNRKVPDVEALKTLQHPYVCQ